MQSPVQVCVFPPQGGQGAGRGKPGSWGQGCLGAWDQIFCLARGGFITGCRTFEGGPPEGLVPRKSGLPWGEVATGPNAWPGTSPPFPPREPGSPPSGHSKLCLQSLPSARHSHMVSGALSLLILKTSLQSRYYFNLHFTDGESEDQRGQVAWPRSPSQGDTQPGFKPREAGSRAQSRDTPPPTILLPVKPCVYILLRRLSTIVYCLPYARQGARQIMVHFIFSS